VVNRPRHLQKHERALAVVEAVRKMHKDPRIEKYGDILKALAALDSGSRAALSRSKRRATLVRPSWRISRWVCGIEAIP
jgi:hypothetical protein